MAGPGEPGPKARSKGCWQLGEEAEWQGPGRAQGREEANLEQIKEDPGRLSKVVLEQPQSPLQAAWARLCLTIRKAKGQDSETTLWVNNTVDGGSQRGAFGPAEQPHLGTCWKCTFSGPTPDLPDIKLGGPRPVQ